MEKHKLIGNTLFVEDEGIIGYCECGWTTGHRFSGMIASVAFREHIEGSEKTPAEAETADGDGTADGDDGR